MTNIVDEILFVTDMETASPQPSNADRRSAGTPVVASTIVQIQRLACLST